MFNRPPDPERDPHQQGDHTCHEKSRHRCDLPVWIDMAQLDIACNLYTRNNRTGRDNGSQEVAFDECMAPGRDQDAKGEK